jgi:CheY-like chemotaxis protein
VQGTGLGLHICRTQIEKHGGVLGIASTAASGSVFSCVIPLILAAASDVNEIPKSTSGQCAALTEEPHSEIQSIGTENTLRHELRDALILIVDDSALNVRLCERKLLLALGEGVCCISASDGVQAVAMYRDLLDKRGKKLNAVIMDYHMPLMSGKDAIVAMRALEAERSVGPVPIAAYTAGWCVHEVKAPLFCVTCSPIVLAI